MRGRSRRSSSASVWWRHGRIPPAWTSRLAVGLPVVLTVGLAAAVPPVRPEAAAAAPAKPACPQMLPDEHAALVTARMCGGPVTIAGLTTETDQAVATAQGTVEWEHHYRPVRVRQGTGWAPVDTTLVTRADGSVAPAAAVVDMAFSGGGKSPMVSLTSGKKSLHVASPLGALPTPVLDGDTATYPDVLAGVDLQLRADVDGYAQVLVIKDRKAAKNPKLTRLAFGISGKGLSTKADKAGNLRVVDADGDLVLAGNTPLMWDATAAAARGNARPGAERPAAPSGANSHEAEMPVSVAPQELTVTPSQPLLDAASTVFPVYIDPGLTVNRAGFSVVSSAAPDTAFWNSADDAFVGSWDGGTSKYRSMFSYDLTGSPMAGKYVSSATLNLNEVYASTCQPAQFEVWSVPVPTAQTTWNNQGAWYAQQSTSTVSKGYSPAGIGGASDCPAGAVPMDVTAYMRSAASSGWNGVAFGVRATDETDPNGWKRFSNNPTLSVSYTAYPSIVETMTAPSTPCQTGTGRPYINTLTPLLQARISDPEGALVRPEFAWSTTDGTPIGSAQPTPGQASGQVQATTVPAGAFTNGGGYSWKVRGFDGTTWGPWSSACEFTVDTTAPTAAPSVSSSTYPSGAWAGATGTAGSFTLGAAGITDIAAYVYGLDTDLTTAVNTSSLGANATINLTPASDGKHVLKVASRDRGGNLSPVTSYTFYVGTGAVTAPTTGTQTAAKVTLSGISKTTSSGITYQWRRGDTDAWTTIPAAHVTTTTGAAITWPVATTGSGAYPNLVWNVAQTVNGLDGPVQVRASLSGSTAGVSTGVNFTLDRDRTEAASAQIGPGSVNLLTGNYTLDSTDVSTIGGLSVQRTFNTRLAADVDPMFGPGWTSSIGVPDAGAYTELTSTGSIVRIGGADGSTVTFSKTATTSTGATYTAEVGAESMALRFTSTGDTFTLTEPSGNTITFSRRTTDPAGLYTPTAMRAAGTTTGSSISWTKVTIGTTDVVRPTQVLAPVPAGVSSCAPLVKGCRALTFTYATATTATSTTPGDYNGRIKQISLTSWDPDLATPAMRTVVMAQYAYDTNGRLWAQWDPRLDWGAGNHVATYYTYNSNGTIATMTPPSEQPWSFVYTTIPTDTGAGRLYKVTRSALGAGTWVQTVVYNVPVSGVKAPVDMASMVNRWGQTAVPVDATSVYPGDIVPDGNPATGTLPTFSTDDRVTVTYMDTNGRATNTMSPGGAVDATFYDAFGNIVRQSTAGNIAEALNNSDTDTPTQEAERARLESTEYLFSSDGQRLLETLFPEQQMVRPNWDAVRARTHEVYKYDQGAPSGGLYNLITTVTESMQYVVNGATVDIDSRTATHDYDWALRSQTTTVVDPGGLDLTTRLTYDSATGQVTSTTATGGTAAGTTPATRRTVFYRAGTGSGFSTCDNHAEWATLPCRVYAGGQPSTGPEVPFTTTTYNLYGEPRVVTESNAAGSLRTNTSVYDNAGRVLEVSTTSSLGTPIAKRRTVYNTSTGRVTARQSVDAANTVTASVGTAYDGLGRSTAYTDADGNTATTTYDVLSRNVTVNDGKATQTYSYNGNGEKRGLPTQLVDSQGGTFTATYNSNGDVERETRPDGLTVRYYYNETGQATGLEYVTTPDCNTAACTLYYDYSSFDAHTKARWDSSSFSNSGYGYDNAGRLTGVRQDTLGSCALRDFKFDNASNRTSATSYGPDAAGACQDSNPATTRTWSYDAADRITSTGYGYDTLGRTTTLPQSDTAAGSGDATLTYHVNDMVQSITQGSTSATYTLDVLTARFRSYTTTTAGVSTVRTNHYINDTDEPAWIAENGSYSRPITGLAGLAAIYTGSTGGLEWQITNLHGDVVATKATSGSTVLATFVTDEYGRQLTGTTPRYGYLGDAQRSGDNPAGLITMGVRLYNRTTGRFLQVDPIWGGSANRYDYANQDPVNNSDTSGLASCSCGTVYKYTGPKNTLIRIANEYYGQTGWISGNLSWLIKEGNDFNPIYEYLSGWYQRRYQHETWLHCRVTSRIYYPTPNVVRYVIAVYKYNTYYTQQHLRYRVRVKYVGSLAEFYIYSGWRNINHWGGSSVEYFLRYETVWA